MYEELKNVAYWDLSHECIADRTIWADRDENMDVWSVSEW